MFLQREGKIDLEVGCSVEQEQIISYKRPFIANINETVGAYVIASLQCISVSHLYCHRYGEVYMNPKYPDTLTRIKVGSVLNIALIPLTVSTTAYAGVNLVNTAINTMHSFGRI